MKPIQIKVTEKKFLKIKWDDYSESKIELKYLRDECPCASCKGETILLRSYRPPRPAILSPEMYLISSIEMVGDYAVQIKWKDGHDTGIYSWDYLRLLDTSQNSEEKQNYQPLM
ncbi:MAG TPA: DUF971 domain-containing protein [Ignavibacteriaceae bacterium]|nr:DUF971 domain-containing protein [Ignavibacteriaceae bacterium]